MNSKRLIHLDLLRIIAMWLIIYNHTGTSGDMFFSIARDSKLYLLYILLPIVTRINVPIFFMISGALLLDRKETIKDVLKNVC